MKPYQALAPIYERVIADDDYNKWAQYLIDLLKVHVKGDSGLDMACGSGYFTRAIKKAGYNVEGIDSSPDMLNEATTKARHDGLNILFRLGDMSNVKCFKKVDFITVINDGINYIPHSNIEKTFKHFYSLLNKDGVLIFDISSKFKLENVIGNNIFAEDTEDMTYLWFNKLYGDHVDMDISVFTKIGEYYKKSEEEQTQYIYACENITEILQKVGYKSIIATNHMDNKLTSDSLRIQFIAKKG